MDSLFFRNFKFAVSLMAFFPILTVASYRRILRIQPKRTYSIIMWTLFDLPSTVNSGMTVESEGYITEETMFDKLREYHKRIQFY